MKSGAAKTTSKHKPAGTAAKNGAAKTTAKPKTAGTAAKSGAAKTTAKPKTAGTAAKSGAVKAPKQPETFVPNKIEIPETIEKTTAIAYVGYIAPEMPEMSAAAEMKPAASEEPIPLPAGEPEPDIAEEPIPLPADEPKPEIAEEPIPPPAEEPEPDIAEEPIALIAEEPESAAAKEPIPLRAEEPEPSVAEEPTPLPAEEPEPSVAEKPIPLVAEEPEPDIAEEQEPVSAVELKPAAGAPVQRVEASAVEPYPGVKRSARRKNISKALAVVASLLIVLAVGLAVSGPQLASLADIPEEESEESHEITISEPQPVIPVIPDEVLSVSIPRKETYLPFGGTQQLEAVLEISGMVDETITWSVSNEEIASVSADGLVTGHANGVAVVTAAAGNGMSDSVEVVVTDCIILPSYERKEFIPSHYYSEEEAELMDKILFSRVADAGGYGSRGAVVAAARFITLEMPYMIPYFYENGRMDANPGRPVCDGEGRYYHVGLYLSESKYDSIRKSVAGPAFWGAPLTNYQNEGYFTAGLRYPNGLSCSGYVSWAMINGGIDTGDIGAGNYVDILKEFYDIGERAELSVELLQSGVVRPGDLIGKDGHIAIVAGIDDTHIWISESYFRGVQVVRFTIDRGVMDCNEYDYVINMDHMYYNGEGVFTNTWE